MVGVESKFEGESEEVLGREVRKGGVQRRKGEGGSRGEGRRVSPVASGEAPHAQNPARNSSSFIPRYQYHDHHSSPSPSLLKMLSVESY